MNSVFTVAGFPYGSPNSFDSAADILSTDLPSLTKIFLRFIDFLICSCKSDFFLPDGTLVWMLREPEEYGSRTLTVADDKYWAYCFSKLHPDDVEDLADSFARVYSKLSYYSHMDFLFNLKPIVMSLGSLLSAYEVAVSSGLADDDEFIESAYEFLSSANKQVYARISPSHSGAQNVSGSSGGVKPKFALYFEIPLSSKGVSRLVKPLIIKAKFGLKDTNMIVITNIGSILAVVSIDPQLKVSFFNILSKYDIRRVFCSINPRLNYEDLYTSF